MTKMSNKHTLSMKKDPLADVADILGTMKGFKGASHPKNPFKNGTPKGAHDEPYAPHSGKVKK